MLEVFPADGAHAQFQFEVGDHRTEVGISASFSIAVDRTLHLHRAQLHGGNGVGHRHVAIVVSVNPQGRFGLLRRRLITLADVSRQRAAVGVAQHQAVSSCFFGGLERSQGISRVGFEPVEEMLGVVDHFPSMRLQEGHRRLANQLEVFLQ